MYYLRINGKVKKSHINEIVISNLMTMIIADLADQLYTFHTCHDNNAYLAKSPDGKVWGISYDDKEDHAVHSSDFAALSVYTYK